jgi:hypothetical protein
MKIQISVLWVVTSCSDVVGYQRFGGHGAFFSRVSRRHNLEERDWTRGAYFFFLNFSTYLWNLPVLDNIIIS